MTHPIDEIPGFDTVELTDEEIVKSVELADQMDIKVPNKQTFYYPNRNRIGIEGEFAFAKYYGLGDPKLYKNGGDTYDYHVYSKRSKKNVTIDVKTITYPEGDMLIQVSKYQDKFLSGTLPTAYFLIEKRGNNYAIIGYIKAKDVLTYDIYPEETYSPVEVYHIPRDDLNPAPDPEILEPARETEDS